MIARPFISAVISLAILFGCANEQSKQLRLQVSRGVGGFTGAVRPIDKPVQVEMGQVISYTAEIRMYADPIDGPETSSLALVSGAQLRVGNKFLRTLQIDRLEQDGTVWEAQRPTAKIESWYDQTGKSLGKPGVSFPAFERGYRNYSTVELNKLREKFEREI